MELSKVFIPPFYRSVMETQTNDSALRMAESELENMSIPESEDDSVDSATFGLHILAIGGIATLAGAVAAGYGLYQLGHYLLK